MRRKEAVVNYTSIALITIFSIVMLIFSVNLITRPDFLKSFESDFWSYRAENVTPLLKMLESDRSDLDVHEILKRTDEFVQIDKDEIVYQESDSSVWLMLEPSDSFRVLEDQYVFFSNFPHTKSYTFYFPFDKDGEICYECSDTHKRLGFRTDAIHPYVYLPDLALRDEPILIRLDGDVFKLKLMVSALDDFSSFQNKLIAFYAANLAWYLSIGMINLILFASTKIRMYACHGIYILLTGAALFLNSALGNLIFGESLGEYFLKFQQLSLFFAIQFIYSYLEVKRGDAFVKITARGMIGLTAVSTLVTWLLTSPTQFLLAVFTANMVYVAVFVLSVYSYLKYKRITIWFPWVMFLLILTAVLNNLQFYNWVTYSVSIELLTYTAVALESLIFTMSILSLLKFHQSENELLKNKVMYDALTGLKNRHYFDFYVREKITLLEADGYSTAMMFVDIDHFKDVNDTFGHDVGDEILKELAKVLKQSIRSDDVVIRWGGEEFAVFLYRVTQQTAMKLAEKIRTNVENHSFIDGNKLTVSIGVAQKHGTESLDKLYKRSDRALYKAKREGRNRVVVSELEAEDVAEIVPYQWSDAFHSGHVEIDRQHRELLELMNEIIVQYLEHGSRLYLEEWYDRMLVAVERHFYWEESVLSKHGYDEIVQHRAVHKQLLNDLKSFKQLVDANSIEVAQLIRFLGDQVIVSHLVHEDMKFFGCLKEFEQSVV